MDISEIRRLVKLVEKSGISELEIETDDGRVKIVKQIPQDGRVAATVMPESSGNTAPSPQLPTASAHVRETTPVEAETRGLAEVTSPMVGTFYRAPAPEAPPYVRIGDHVDPGSVLCIIEAMKLMNEIEAEVSGRIVEIVAENAQPVEFGQLLFRIEPD